MKKKKKEKEKIRMNRLSGTFLFTGGKEVAGDKPRNERVALFLLDEKERYWSPDRKLIHEFLEEKII